MNIFANILLIIFLMGLLYSIYRLGSARDLQESISSKIEMEMESIKADAAYRRIKFANNQRKIRQKLRRKIYKARFS